MEWTIWDHRRDILSDNKNLLDMTIRLRDYGREGNITPHYLSTFILFVNKTSNDSSETWQDI